MLPGLTLTRVVVSRCSSASARVSPRSTFTLFALLTTGWRRGPPGARWSGTADRHRPVVTVHSAYLFSHRACDVDPIGPVLAQADRRSGCCPIRAPITVMVERHPVPPLGAQAALAERTGLGRFAGGAGEPAAGFTESKCAR